MAASVRSAAGDDDLEGRAALKTYLLEPHGPAQTDAKRTLTAALSPHGLLVEDTDEPELLSLSSGEQVSWLDMSPGRPWRLHVSASVKDADRIHEQLTTATPFVTALRLLPARLESLAEKVDGKLVLFSLRHDRRPLRATRDADSDAVEENIDVVTLRFWAATASRTLQVLRERDVLPGATSVSSVQLRIGDASQYARVEVYHDGKCTAVGSSFAHFERLLEAIVAEYDELRTLVDTITARNRRIVLRIPWRSDAIEPAVERMFVGGDPFALWGLPERLGEHHFRARVVDLDAARTALVEVSREGLSIELAADTPACVALRWLTNIQFHLHADFELEPLFLLQAGGTPARREPAFDERAPMDRVAAAAMAEAVAQWLRGQSSISVQSLASGLFGADRATQGHVDLLRKVLAEAAAYEWSDWLKPSRDESGNTVYKLKIEPQRDRTARARQLLRLYKLAASLTRRLAGGNVEPWSQLSLFDAESLVPPEPA